jgi:hypothetical protein
MEDLQLTGRRMSVPATVESFLANLPELLEAMVRDSRCLVAIAEFAYGRYVQFRVDDGLVITEVVSNRFIVDFLDGDEALLSENDEALLREHGWEEPTSTERPNWRWTSDDESNLLLLAAMVQDVVVRIVRERPFEELRFQLWVFEEPLPNSSITAA